MGATVVLYNRYDRAVEQALTNADGTFVFTSLMPDLYSLRVSLSSFIPAFKRNISVKPGFHSVLTINMASMLSSIELISTAPAKGSLMTEDWKWVLRSSQATRPVLRHSDVTKDPIEPRRSANVFSETRGLLKVSAGDATSFTNSNQADLGTAFAVATSFLGTNQLEVSGNFGVSAQTGLPVAGFRSKYVRGGGRTPELTIGMHQIYLPVRGGFGSRVDGAPAMRAVSVTMLDEFALADRVRLEYGMTAESVSLLNRLNMLSPFARLTYDLGNKGTLRVAYSSGSEPMDLAARLNDGVAREDGALNRNLTALATVPRISLRDGRTRAQRTENAEVGYTMVSGSRRYTAGVYREHVRDGSLMLAGSGTLYDGDVLPDLTSRSSIFNIGNFDRWGYLASVSQSLGERVELALSYGRGGTLSADNVELRSARAEELRGLVRVRNRNWATARASATLPGTGTRVGGSYGWADFRSLMPSHTFLTHSFVQEPGVNITIRQPLPSFGGPGRFEATAELRNLLEQGYLPIATSDRGTMVLTNAPRAVRGGLSFIF